MVVAVVVDVVVHVILISTDSIVMFSLSVFVADEHGVDDGDGLRHTAQFVTCFSASLLLHPAWLLVKAVQSAGVAHYKAD